MKGTPAAALLAWLKVNKPDMYEQVKRWFDAPNAQTKSLADLLLMGFEAGKAVERADEAGRS